MPYIEQSLRGRYESSINIINYFLEQDKFNVGIITYVMYRIIKRWWELNKSYKTICEIRGVLIGTMDEFNRREAHHYEDKKIKENGDV